MENMEFSLKKIFMERAIQLARNGLGTTSPNPMVGCVIEKNGVVISEGWHYKFGMNHAEVEAINKIKDNNSFVNSTLYVTLEPCIHFGKTSPCVDLIIKKKIPIVVIGIRDPYQKVNGLGIKKLINNGIKVVENFLEDECLVLNKRFFTFHKKNRPYIILKWAQSNDGFIYSSNRKNKWISGENARQLNHKWRSEEDSILVGKKTVLNDNPKLNVRKWYGKNPVRIFIDKKLSIPDSYFVLDGTQKTIIFTEKNKKNKKNIEYICLSFKKGLIKNILNHLYKRNIQSLIVEGGKNTLENFIKENMWDECRIFVCNTTLKCGIETPIIKGKMLKSVNIGKDILFYLSR